MLVGLFLSRVSPVVEFYHRPNFCPWNKMLSADNLNFGPQNPRAKTRRGSVGGEGWEGRGDMGLGQCC